MHPRRRARLRIRHFSEQGQSLVKSFTLIAAVFITGVVGFVVIGGEQKSIVDSIYMTIITLTTVGYGEVIDVSGSPGAKLFTSALLLVGVGSFVYFFSNFTAFVVEGNLEQFLWRRKMRKAVDSLSGHYIVCGAGSTGEHVVRELIATERPFVLIEADEDRAKALLAVLETDFPIVAGDATDDDALLEAGIERAKGLAACVASDKDNLIITVSARMLKKELRIVTRCVDDRAHKKIRQAGADAIVSPNMIGGLRLVSELIRPGVVSFLDEMLRDKNRHLRVEEYEISADSGHAGETLAHFRAEHPTLLVVACREADESWAFNPEDDKILEPGIRVVFMGDPQARAELEADRKG
jgi:voltage-gated potassium channel